MPSSSKSQLENLGIVLAVALAVLWIATGAALSTRFHLVFFYDTRVTVTPALEIIAVSPLAFLVLSLTGSIFPVLVYFGKHNQAWRAGLGLGFITTLPLLLMIGRCFSDLIPSPRIWEVVWYAVFTGLGIGKLARTSVTSSSLPRMFWASLLAVSVMGAFGWWLFQSHAYYQDYLLGFNDFGHFSQRIANTAAGRGFLLETQVLPIFWDHFNPGLALLAPLWLVWPSVYMVFVLQALSLVTPALVIASIVYKLGGGPSSATLWGISWLAQPAIGQMNLAYTYGWHPITIAVPFLLLSYRLLLSSRYVLSAVLACVACSFEEGVIVVVGCFAAAMFLKAWAEDRETKHSNVCLSKLSWFMLFMIATIAFALVYSMSGLAKFQTGRFAKLGDSAFAIMLSPIYKPAEFWGLFFRPRNGAFLSLLLAPFVVAGIMRCRWHLLSLVLPLGVLVVWEHLPAQSIAFQYTCCLFPVLFIGCIEGSLRVPVLIATQTWNSAVACLATGWVLCLFVGQMPWSQETIMEVIGITYDLQQGESRRRGSEALMWLDEQVEQVRTTQVHDISTGTYNLPRVLATGRIASHIVGMRDLETVSQYWQRERELAKLEPSLASPILRYDVIVLDFRERFQQTEAETKRVQDEALKHGFRLEQNRFGIAVLVRSK